jgi:recombination protein RecT
MATPATTAETPAKKEQNIAAKVMDQIKRFTATGEIQMPPNYSPENALKGAWIVIQETVDKNKRPVLDVCTQPSIASALFKMCIEGLSALKGQGYFIAYDDKLRWSRDYNGERALAKRVGGVKDVPANVVFEGDDFDYAVDPKTGYQYLVTHKPNPKGRDMDKIQGAYAIVIYKDGRSNLEYMSIDEIRTAWQQGPTNGNSPAHKKFPQEMCKKTVIHRACKEPINSSDDGYLFYDVEETQTEDVAHTIVDEVNTTTGTKKIEFAETDAVDPGY